MRIKDDICYPDKVSEIDGILAVYAVPRENRLVEILFTNGEKRILDTKLFAGPVFEPLDDATVFQNIKIVHGVLTWENGEIDIAPETAYQKSEMLEKEIES